jgi:Major coat protein-like
MVSLAKTPAEVKEDMAPMVATSLPPSAPQYPYGCCISLENDTLKKLGLDGDLPAVGDVIEFMATAKVTSASMNERVDESGKPETCCRVELQITDMDVAETEDPAEEELERSAMRRQRFYGQAQA